MDALKREIIRQAIATKEAKAKSLAAAGKADEAIALANEVAKLRRSIKRRKRS